MCIELKHGSNGSGIYWGPLQIAVYKELFDKKHIHSFFMDIKELIQQKVALDLLPQKANIFYENHITFDNVIPALIIGEPNHKMNCWIMMKEIINQDIANLQCEVLIIDENGKIAPWY